MYNKSSLENSISRIWKFENYKLTFNKTTLSKINYNNSLDTRGVKIVKL